MKEVSVECGYAFIIIPLRILPFYYTILYLLPPCRDHCVQQKEKEKHDDDDECC